LITLHVDIIISLKIIETKKNWIIIKWLPGFAEKYPIDSLFSYIKSLFSAL
jgi:hypothetical protein